MGADVGYGAGFATELGDEPPIPIGGKVKPILCIGAVGVEDVTDFAAIDPGLKDGITTTVYQGRVLLTGTVPTPQMKMRAVEVASRVSGIKALYDDVELAPSRATWDATNDAWITARIRSGLMLDPDIRSGNYTIDTQKGSVYLIGSARSQVELERATRTARYIPGVKRVVTYVELRPGAPVAQQPTPSVVPARSGTGSQSPQGS